MPQPHTRAQRQHVDRVHALYLRWQNAERAFYEAVEEGRAKDDTGRPWISWTVMAERLAWPWTTLQSRTQAWREQHPRTRGAA